MTINRYTLFLACSLLLFAGSADLQGQIKDFQSWWELELEKKVSARLDLNAEFEQRFKNNSLQYSGTLMTLAASYDVLDFLSLSGGARTVFFQKGEQMGIGTRFRLHMDGTGSWDLSGYELSLRARVQYAFADLADFRLLSFNGFINRNRLKVDHHIFGSRFDCFAAVESWHGSTLSSRWRTLAMRYSAGLRFTPDFSSRFSLRYMLEDEFNVIYPRQLHIVVAGYSYRF